MVKSKNLVLASASPEKQDGARVIAVIPKINSSFEVFFQMVAMVFHDLAPTGRPRYLKEAGVGPFRHFSELPQF